MLAAPVAAANLTYEFAGSLTTTYADSTNSPNLPGLNTLLGGAYAGFLSYDDATGAISAGELRFASGYGTNNYASLTAPAFVKSQWQWGDVTYQLTGSLLPGSPSTLITGGVLDPLTMKANTPAVDALGTSNLIAAIAGVPPVCTSLDPSRQSINCFEPPANTFGIDALVLSISGDGSHVLAFDEIIDFCGPTNPCSTSWYHFSGAGTGAVVPLPAAGWFLVSALGGLASLGRRRG